MSCFIITSHSLHSEIISGGEGARDGGEKGVSGGRKEGRGRRKRGKGDEGKGGLLTTCKAIKTHCIMSSDDIHDVTNGQNDILLRTAVHFGL